MMREDDKRFYELSAKQAEYKIRRRGLAKRPDRVYSRSENLRVEQKLPSDIEKKYEAEIFVDSLLNKKRK
jgi:hypothetical protein